MSGILQKGGKKRFSVFPKASEEKWVVESVIDHNSMSKQVCKAISTRKKQTNKPSGSK